MIDGREWIALFSHTGSEIVNISNRLGFGPDRVITNKMGTVHRDLNHCTRTRPKPDDQDYQLLFADKEPIITLHGWMRIIPGSICEEYDIYNLHPGLITQYPELKGKDPQERVFTTLNIPQYVGCVIHRATEELDSGEIIMSRRVLNTYPSVKLLTHALHDMAGDMWVDFFEKKLYNNE
jgi:folate-dependent phosphoribosylglycinamide formyltransferase PurN